MAFSDLVYILIMTLHVLMDSPDLQLFFIVAFKTMLYFDVFAHENSVIMFMYFGL